MRKEELNDIRVLLRCFLIPFFFIQFDKVASVIR